jgi:hypothetical protein
MSQEKGQRRTLVPAVRAHVVQQDRDGEQCVVNRVKGEPTPQEVRRPHQWEEEDRVDPVRRDLRRRRDHDNRDAGHDRDRAERADV